MSVAGATLAATMSAGVALSVNILMSRALGPSVRGEVALVLQVSYFVSPLLLLGRDREILRRASALASKRVLLLPIGIAVGAALLTFGDWFLAMAVLVALSGAALVLERNEGLQRSKLGRFFLLSMAYQAGIFFGAVVLTATEAAQPWLWLLPYAIPSAFVVFRELRQLGRSSWTVRAVKRTLAFIYLLPASVAHLLVTRVERLMLPALASYEALGVYIAVATATEPLVWLAQALADRRVSGHRTTTLGALGRSLTKDLALFMPIAAAMGVIVWFAIIPLLGPGFAWGRQLVIPLTVASILLAVYRQMVSRLLASTQPGRSSFCECITAGMGIVIYVVCITSWGAHGAAWGSLAVYISGCFVAAVLLVRGGLNVREGATPIPSSSRRG